jgi:hypothetical protein
MSRLTSALSQLVPFNINIGVTMASGFAVAVAVGWLLVPAAAGAWRTQTRDAQGAAVRRRRPNPETLETERAAVLARIRAAEQRPVVDDDRLAAAEW